MVKAHIPVGVEVECRPGSSRWSRRVWRPVALRPGRHTMPDWSILSEEGGTTRYYAGTTSLIVRSAETALYKDNISARDPAVYVVLRRTPGPIGWKLLLVSVDPSEAQAHTEVGDDLVEALPMPAALQDWLASFVAGYHLDRTQWKRERDAKKPAGEPAHTPPDGEGFLDRWSRLKQTTRTEAAALPGGEVTQPPTPASPPVPPPEPPSLESLQSRSDFASFLRNELPKEVRLATLRQAWRADRVIAGHRPLVDYDWNFNAPGYGRPLPTDSPDQLIESLFGYLRRAADASSDGTSAGANEASPEVARDPAAASENAPGHEETPEQHVEQHHRERRHGSAAPRPDADRTRRE